MLTCVVAYYSHTEAILDPNLDNSRAPADWPHDDAFQRTAGKLPRKGQFIPQGRGDFPPPNTTKKRADVSATSKVADGLVQIGQSISALSNAQAGHGPGPQIRVSSEEKQATYLGALTALQLDPGSTTAVQVRLAELINAAQDTTKMMMVGSWLVTATKMSKFSLEDMDVSSPNFEAFKHHFYRLWALNAAIVQVEPPKFD
jgi:hypothetical protein